MNDEILRILNAARSDGRDALLEHEGKELLAISGVETTRFVLAKTEEGAAKAAEEIGFPVVLKIVSPQILHKMDVGGVILDLGNESEVREGYREILRNIRTKAPNAEVSGVLVQEMVPPSTEIIVGAIRDPQFGPAIMFGIGGIFTEVIKDVTFRIAPLTMDDAEEMIGELKARAVLEGARGLPKADLNAIVEVILKISEVMMAFPEIESVDLNPIIVSEREARVVDARFILGEVDETVEKDPPPSDVFDALLEPRSVAIIGASSNVEKIGHKILNNLIEGGFEGRIYPINPRADEILGVKAYPSILDAPGEIDVCVVAIPARFVPSVIEECVEKGVKGSIVISSGFRDVGPEGAELERNILEIAGKGGLRIIGPNCQGVSNPKAGFCATWPLVMDVGGVAVISQSGTIALEVPSFLSRNEIGYSKAIALGNKSDVDEADLMSWLADDESTNVIAVYTEGTEEGRKLMRAVRKASAKKPVLFLKGGKTEAGKRAVMAHTGSLAGMTEVFEAAVKQSGGISVKNLDELCNASKAFSTSCVPKGNRVFVITSSGGSGILASDACNHAGLELSTISDATRGRLEERLPQWCVIGNPLDLTGNVLNNVQIYKDSLEIALEEEAVDMVLLIFGDPIPDAFETLKDVIEKAASREIPVVVIYLGGADVQVDETEKFQKNGIPVYSTPSSAIVSLGYLNQYRERIRSSTGFEEAAGP